jgi:transcriptional regulator with XRE-family HTH domain
MLPNPNNFKFSEALLKARKKAGLTQEQLAAKAGIAKVMPGRYERGVHAPDMDNWAKLNRVLFPEADESEIEAAVHSDNSPALMDATVEELIEELKRRGFTKVSLANG